jgi:hypothetical protein
MKNFTRTHSCYIEKYELTRAAGELSSGLYKRLESGSGFTWYYRKSVYEDWGVIIGEEKAQIEEMRKKS